MDDKLMEDASDSTKQISTEISSHLSSNAYPSYSLNIIERLLQDQRRENWSKAGILLERYLDGNQEVTTLNPSNVHIKQEQHSPKYPTAIHSQSLFNFNMSVDNQSMAGLYSRTSSTGSVQVDPQLTNMDQQSYRVSQSFDSSHGPGISPTSLQQKTHPHIPNTFYESPEHALDHAPDHTSVDQKRQRACESCRSLKVKCEPDVENPNGTCRRCAKAHRECIFTAPTRKRQKRTDSRVAELEKKIDRLTASLAAQRRGEHYHDEGHHSDENEDTEAAVNQGSPFEPPRLSGRKSLDASSEMSRRNSVIDTTTESPRAKRQKIDRSPPSRQNSKEQASEPANKAEQTPDSATTSAAWTALYATPRPPLPPFKTTFALTPETDNYGIAPPTSDYVDVIDRKLLSMEMATEIFDRYNTEFVRNMPAVVFPKGTTAAQVRAQKPVLFLSILAAAAGLFHADLFKALNKELNKILAEKVMVNGEKSLELVQALIVTTIWYSPPENFEELKFYTLTHLAAVMAIDIGISRRGRIGGKPKGGMPMGGCFGNKSCGEPEAVPQRGGPEFCSWRKNNIDPGAAECRRSFLACYFMCSNVAMALRRPNLLRYSIYMGECVDYLETSDEAEESDKVLCQWVRVQRIAEEVGLAWAYDESTTKINIADSRVQFALRGFERQLEEWNKSRPKTDSDRWLDLHNHTVSLYMHEIALHNEHPCDDFRAPYQEDAFKRPAPPTSSDGLLTQCQIDALYNCMTSAHTLLDIFISFTVEETKTQPALIFVRLSYSMVILMKMYFSASQPKSELGRLIDKNSLRIEYYLDKILERLQIISEEGKASCGTKFIIILSMLKTWYYKQNGEKGKGEKDGTNYGSEIQRSRSVQSSIRAFSSPRQFPSRPQSTEPTIQVPPLDSGSTLPSSVDSVQTPLHMLSDVAMGGGDKPQGQQSYITAKMNNGELSSMHNMDVDPTQNQLYNNPSTEYNPMLGANSNLAPWNVSWGDMTFDMPADGMFMMDDALLMDFLDTMPNAGYNDVPR